MKKLIFFFLLISINSFSQNNLKDLLKNYNTESIPYISVDSLKTISNDVVLLDAREKNEFKTSHLENALFVGYDKFNLKKTIKKLPNKNAKVVVYCSLGVRSEDVAEQLKKAGYKNVLNLYGGIFEWKNHNQKVYNSKGKETEKVHAFSKEWSKWLLKGEKVYE
ncbi:rhodanese-like domain-containing protein [Tenacibaculum sp. K20-16]|nr:rhodanese-like domain-containing protein [Tenacibaculum sp. 1_MG-2023]MCH3881864.1 rhodanese-like domain-containing protein [Tenacibaculum aquimarinum]MDO6598567.1 rhodanese-like domain-containing protein [Tenacibaculum sp. 1_MG-2023]